MADYKETLYLPKTAFALKSNPSAREEKILQQWQVETLYSKVRAAQTGREKFVLHSGPPYANGHIHVGHALNYILKDIIVRLHQLQGEDTPLVPGWDCHGLPIEWKVEEAYRAQGQSKDAVSVVDFRAACRAFAQKWIDVQKKEFQRLGLLWDWDNAYITMDYQVEADIVATLFKFLDQDRLYKGVKPVLWSVVEKTALAEAEVEYEDKISSFVYVRFPVKESPLDALKGTSVIIWTTTPWTLPGNRAVSYGPDITYAVYKVTGVSEESLAQVGEHLLIATTLSDTFARAVGIDAWEKRMDVSSTVLEKTLLYHPLLSQGYDFPVPLIAGDHVTTEAGTGLVHTAPGHGLEDFIVCQHHGIEVPETVAEDGTYYPHVPQFAGQHIFKIDSPLIEMLTQHDMLVKAGKMTHSYPHSWRSKAPLIYRTTPQWFISVEKGSLRQQALQEIKKVKWIPASGENRLHGMVESRPDWLISRQRAWGVPIALFIDKRTGQPLKDAQVNQRILEAMQQEGADAWFSSPPNRFLGADYDPQHFEQAKDILDVWFESGCSSAFVLEQNADLACPADLYVEGSDQHRGWFQSSLLISCGTRQQAPYKSVLTHGFALDEKGYKMSKSQGNVVAPEKVIETLGAEILRLWVVNSDFTEDLRLGQGILKHQEDIYRRYRNTLRYLLGALAGFQGDERVSFAALPELEKWVVHRLCDLQQRFLALTETYELQNFYAALHTFCATDLSAFYFDVRKDILYCDDRDSPSRRSARSTMDLVFQWLLHWLSPVLCFTVEEAWQEYQAGRQKDQETESPGLNHFFVLSTAPVLPSEGYDSALGQRFDRLRLQRRLITSALEQARAAGMIGASLQAEVTIYDPEGVFEPYAEWAELVIVSQFSSPKQPLPQDAYQLEEVPHLGVKVQPASGLKCDRCWKVLPEVGHHPVHLTLCPRCVTVVETLFHKKSQEDDVR